MVSVQTIQSNEIKRNLLHFLIDDNHCGTGISRDPPEFALSRFSRFPPFLYFEKYFYSLNMEDTVKVVEITDENFESQLPDIQKTVSESIFVAFDLEFSGLELKSFHKSITVDTVCADFYFRYIQFETRYAKMKQR